MAKNATAYACNPGSKAPTAATSCAFCMAICGSDEMIPSATTPTKLKTPSASAIVRWPPVASENRYGSSSATDVVTRSSRGISSSTAWIAATPPAVDSRSSNRYTISPDAGSTSGAPLNLVSAGSTKDSSSVPMDTSSLSRKGASCSAVTTPLFFWMHSPTSAHRLRSKSALGSPSPKTKEKTASRKSISLAPSIAA